MEITEQEAKLLLDIRQLGENDELHVRIGSKYGHKVFVCLVQQRKIIASPVDKIINAVILEIGQVVVTQQNDGQHP